MGKPLSIAQFLTSEKLTIFMAGLDEKLELTLFLCHWPAVEERCLWNANLMRTEWQESTPSLPRTKTPAGT